MENLNLDFSQTVHIDTEQQPWLPSPMQGVERKPLARQQQESGHATSIVRYLPGARFKRHLHPLGEEILVLSGTFSDEHGNYSLAAIFATRLAVLMRPLVSKDALCLSN